MSLQTKSTQLLFLFAKRAFRHLLSDAVPTQFSEFSKNSVKIFSPTLRLIYMGERRPPAKPGPPPGRCVSRISMLFPGSERREKPGGWCEMFQCIVHTKAQSLTLILESAWLSPGRRKLKPTDQGL